MKLFPDHLADRFRRFKYRHFAPNIDHYEKLATEGQNPDVMVVSCCDSRVDPETLFSAMPGELFWTEAAIVLGCRGSASRSHRSISASDAFERLQRRCLGT